MRSPNQTPDRMTRSAIALTFHAGRWGARSSSSVSFVFGDRLSGSLRSLHSLWLYGFILPQRTQRAQRLQTPAQWPGRLSLRVGERLGRRFSSLDDEP